jgi:hypothetical protein
MGKLGLMILAVAAVTLGVFLLWPDVETPMDQVQAASLPDTDFNLPIDQRPMASVEGVMIDLTCAARAKVLTGSWDHTGLESVSEAAAMQDCLTLKKGQPAALFYEGRVQAVFACNPRGGGKIQRTEEHGNPHALTKYADAPVVVEGFWADQGTNLFVPVRIRRRILHAESFFTRGGWHTVDCNHDGVPFSASDSLVPPAAHH